jgi:hypothetical protein
MLTPLNSIINLTGLLKLKNMPLNNLSDSVSVMSKDLKVIFPNKSINYANDDSLI